MACSLTKSADDPSHFTARPGVITLKTAASHGNIQFTAHFSIKDQNGAPVTPKLLNNNQSLQFTAAKGHTYTLFLPFAFQPTSSVGHLEEDCDASELKLPLVNINFSATLVIAC
jgi:hypothetical protein